MKSTDSPSSRNGRFSLDGKSYVVTRPESSRPWVNVISTGKYGVLMSQTGAGYSWRMNGEALPVTRPSADGESDSRARALYLRDDQTGEFWSVGWEPVRPKFDSYECVHGIGYSMFTSQRRAVQAHWFVFVPYDESLEVWRLRIRNTSNKPRKLSLWSYVDWAGGDLKTASHDEKKIVLARSASGRTVYFHGIHLPAADAFLRAESFLGKNGGLEEPSAMSSGKLAAVSKGPAAAGFHLPAPLKAGEERSVLFTIGAAGSDVEALDKARRFQDFAHVDRSWNRTELFWEKCLEQPSVRLPELNGGKAKAWSKYNALASYFWTRISSPEK